MPLLAVVVEKFTAQKTGGDHAVWLIAAVIAAGVPGAVHSAQVI
jgi:hypothetical protein